MKTPICASAVSRQRGAGSAGSEPAQGLRVATPVTAPARRARSLRSRWNRRLAGLLAAVVIGAVAGMSAMQYGVTASRDAAERVEAQSSVSAGLRADVAAAVIARHNLIEGDQDAAGQVAMLEADVAARFDRAVGGSGPDRERRLFEEARDRWEQAVAAVPGGPLSASEKLALHASLAGAGDEVAMLVDRASGAGRAGTRAVLARTQAMERTVFAAMALAAAAIVAFLGRFARRLSTEVLVPVARLRDAAERLAGGRFDHRVHLERADELGELAASFNTMADAVAGSHRQLSVQASHDSLTGLANRAAFRARLDASMSEPERRGGSLAVLFVDLDDFKEVNDSLGHAAGDQLLAEVAARMAGTLRSGALVARLGGDEFAVLLDGVTGPEGALASAERVLAAICGPAKIANTEVRVGASIGIAIRDDASSDPDELMRRADVAMYLAKGRGKNRVEHYDPALDAAAADRQQLKADLHGAAERGELVVDYQPIVALATGRVGGVEALVRWQHPTRGLLGPNEFIPTAEANGAIVAIGASVLETAARQARIWQDAHGRPDLTVSVNVSARQLDQPDFPDLVTSILRDAGLEAATLVIEITETALADPAGPAIPTLRALRRLGVRIAIDDFGTGYSSLGSLRQLPVDILKIDRSFVSGDHAGAHDAGLLDAVVELGRRLDLDVIAEGVETTDQRARLEALGCARAQGFLWARPVPPATIGEMLATADRSRPVPSHANLEPLGPRRSMAADPWCREVPLERRSPFPGPLLGAAPLSS